MISGDFCHGLSDVAGDNGVSTIQPAFCPVVRAGHRTSEDLTSYARSLSSELHLAIQKSTFRQSNDSRLHNCDNRVVTFGLLVRIKRSSTQARYSSDGPYVRHVCGDEEQSVWKDATDRRHIRPCRTGLFYLSVRSLRSTVSRQLELCFSLNFELVWFPEH
jgi:hypothetical protein